nr:class I SAM-dependent methyltransferase [Mangrovicoccus sp. HB161399]
MAKRYAATPVRDEAAYREKLRRTRKYLSADSHLLEAGCGTGSTALAHAPHVSHVEATDFSPNMIEIAERKRAAAGIVNVAFRTAWWDELSGEYDAVLALNLFHVLPHPDAAVAHLASLVKPGGVLVTSTTCVADNSVIARKLAPVFAMIGVFPPISVFGRDTYLGWLEAAGLEPVESWHPGRMAAWFDIARRPGAA